MKTFILLLGVFFFAGCDQMAPDSQKQIFNVPKQQVEGPRFTVESQGTFQAGYNSNNREILIITDNFTHRKYLGITGVGVSELHTEVNVNVSTDADGNVTTDTEINTVEQ